jgi:hypothetical protein
MARLKQELKSGKQIYVFSTLANDQRYTEWLPSVGGLPVEGRSVLIKGGSGMMNDRFITPLGISTAIDSDDVPLLEKNHVFRMHQESGFVVISNTNDDPEKVASSSMEITDKSAPLTPADFPEGDQNKVVTNKD